MDEGFDFRLVTEKEIEKVKPWMSSKIDSLLGFEEPTVRAVAIDSITRRLEKKTNDRRLIYINTEKLKEFLDESSSKSFADQLERKLKELRNKKISSSKEAKKENREMMMRVRIGIKNIKRIRIRSIKMKINIKKNLLEISIIMNLLLIDTKMIGINIETNIITNLLHIGMIKIVYYLYQLYIKEMMINIKEKLMEKD